MKFERNPFNREVKRMMSTTIDMSCNILDDDELERVSSGKATRMELRQWIPDISSKENPFEKGFIKPSYSFPKAFQNKAYSEEFPPLIQRVGMRMSTTMSITNLSTTNLLLRVKERLESSAAVSSITATVVAPPPIELPLYAVCTPDYPSATPPYPPQTPPYPPY